MFMVYHKNNDRDIKMNLKKIEKGKLRKRNILYYSIKQKKKKNMTVKYVTAQYYSFYKVPLHKNG